MDLHPEFPKKRTMPECTTHKHNESRNTNRDPIEFLHMKKYKNKTLVLYALWEFYKKLFFIDYDSISPWIFGYGSITFFDSGKIIFF